MKISRAKGFTLIELLTVMAIISILAAMVMVVGPRVLERAKLRRLDSALRQVSIALTAYYTDNRSYPPGYGYIGFAHANNTDAPDPNASPTEDPGYYHLLPYMHILGYHADANMYDEFSDSYDTDRDDQLSLLEFSPHGELQQDGKYKFEFKDWPRYMGPGTLGLEVEEDRQLTADNRPFIYIPINKLQFSRAQKYWLQKGAKYAEVWDPADPLLKGLTFPPRTYDAFVLLSLGPGGSTFGLLPQPLGVAAETANNSRDLYHITGLRAYFMATRDWNANGVLDFDFRSRTQLGEAAPDLGNELPPGQPPYSYGPYIYVSEWQGRHTRTQ
ncbi:MAG: prepilin-type N-terminal cleavage/methylation domain-containing protein [Candidatus Hydrogenedentes bacterium]|jgi:prepilin-type N-terminal cleavage/methylation domain-containing protein|nr:prepilin-type N-terminal cleavage/methylation domain-containing protein [Candidatus Hydrogenedentota bacterium]